MSVRFNRRGTGVVSDHNDLANKGTHTHAEIDKYLDEIDAARGTNTSLEKRFSATEANVTKNTKDIKDIKDEVVAARGKYGTLKERIDAGSVDPELEKRLKQMEEEVKVARKTYSTLGARLDAMPTGGTGGGGSGGVIAVAELDYPPGSRVKDETVFTTPKYVLGAHTLEVYMEGVLLQVGVDYTETSETSITFMKPVTPDRRIKARVLELIDLSTLPSGGGGVSLKQLTKLDVKAPHEEYVTIKSTTDFSLLPVEVLKFVPSQQNKITNVYAFDNTDKANFEQGTLASFDKKMELKTSNVSLMVEVAGLVQEGRAWVQEINLDQYQSIFKLEVV